MKRDELRALMAAILMPWSLEQKSDATKQAVILVDAILCEVDRTTNREIVKSSCLQCFESGRKEERERIRLWTLNAPEVIGGLISRKDILIAVGE